MKKNGIYKLQIPDREIEINMEFSFRKRLTLTVYPNCRIVARIPYGLSQRKLEDYFQNKSNWMIKHLDHFESHPPETEKNYINGETFSYLGKKYTLQLHQGTSHIMLKNEQLILRTKDIKDKESIQKMLDRWYRKEAIKKLSARYFTKLEQLEYLDLPTTTLRFYKMKRRWGSCSSKHLITLNTELIKKDKELIDYVIVHEICHLKIPAHNKAFYSLVESIIPNWKDRKKRLNENH